MEETIKQETLLRHLLNTKSCAANDEFLYSVLLGFRLFLSPRQLLSELSRLSIEETVRESAVLLAGNICSKCGQMQMEVDDQSSSSKPLQALNLNERGASANANLVVKVGDTLRRKRKGRDRYMPQGGNENLESCKRANRSSESSRDSGIISAYLDVEVVDTSRNDNQTSHNLLNNNMTLPEATKITCTNCSEMTPAERKLSRKRQLVHVLQEWVRHFPADFRNKKIMWMLHDVVKTCQRENEDLTKPCVEVLDCVSRLTAAQESYELHLTNMERGVFLKRSTESRKTKDWMVQLVLGMKTDRSVVEMAQQLCIVETDLLKHVGAEEFLQLFTADGDEDTKTNLGACVRWFNRLSHLVATIICLCRKHKQAKQVITFFAKVANTCFELSNFNSAMAILTGLSLGPVTRLKKAWHKLNLPELDRLQTIFDPSNNFLRYRSIYLSRADKLTSPAVNKVKSHHHRASVLSSSSQYGDSGAECDQENRRSKAKSNGFKFQGSMRHFTFDPTKAPKDAIMVPFLVLLVKDVYFLNHSIETVDKNGTINFEKLHTLSNILRPLEEYKQMTSLYQKQDDLQDFLLRAPIQDDDGLYLLSYKREPPANRFEKHQLKSLKNEAPARRRCQALTI